MMMSTVAENVSVTSDTLVEVLMKEHGHALADTGPFRSDTEYMKLNELKYTLKSVRANVAIKMFESFTRPGSFTTGKGSNETADKSQEKHLNCSDMASRKDHLDSLISSVDAHIASRVNSEATEVSVQENESVFKFLFFHPVSSGLQGFHPSHPEAL